ncbi:MAG TPA: MarC family protein, partial [Caulobacterales bacterium]|nr:MarC family protein [Caulobacterales bacterium]
MSFMLSSFVTLFVTIGPIEAAAVYAGLTAGVHLGERGGLAWRSVVIAGILMLAFAVAGNPVLAWMRVSLPAFRFAAGVLLFLQAITLTFGGRAGLSAINAAEHREAMAPRDIAVFPLAFPIIAGPGALAAIVLLTGRADPLHSAAVLAALILCLAITYAALLGAEYLKKLLGVTGADVVGR